MNDQKRTFEPLNAGQLFASNIFGTAPADVKKTLPTRNFRKKTSRIKLDPATRTERVAFLEVTDNMPPVKAIQPLLTKEAKAKTMDNYRFFIMNYNNCILEKNEEIEKQNASIDVSEFDEVQKEYSRLFYLKNSRLKAAKFNKLANEFNETHGNCIKLKKLQTVKYATELVFFQMLHLYSIQMEEITGYVMKLGVTEPLTVPQFEVNPHHITNLKRESIHSIDVSNKTIRNHKERLEESGVLYCYYFQGTKKGVKMHINSQILTVFDAKSRNLTSVENQSLSPSKGKNVPFNNDTTRAIKNNIKKRENGQAAFLDLGTASPILSFSFFTGDTPPQITKSKLGGGGESVKVLETLSDMLEKQILPTQELAKKLSNGDFNNYPRIKKAVFEKEAYSGTLSRSEMNSLVCQEIFKNAAKLYRGKKVYIGSWKIAINSYLEKLFWHNNGTGKFLCSKSLMADTLEEILWCLTNNQRWFTLKKAYVLFPSDYFDFKRTTAKEMGFEYSRKAYKKHVEYLDAKPRKEKTIAKKDVERKVKINHAKKFDTKINSFLKNRISFAVLFEYVKTNLPPEFMDKLAQRMVFANAETNSNLLN